MRAAVVISCFWNFAASIKAAPLVSWDIPTSTISNAAVSASNAPAAGITASAVSPGSGISISSSSSMWRWINWSTSGTTFAAAVANGDYLEWSLTAGARTAATLTNFSGVQFRNTLLASAVDLYVSTNDWATSTLVGSITGISATNTNNFVTGTQSWFDTAMTIAGGSTARFRFFVRGPSSSSSYIGFNPDLDWTLEGTTSGGPWNLVWNGATNTVSNGVTGLFTGTDNNSNAVVNPALQSGDNVTVGTAGTMNLAGSGVAFGNLVVSNAAGTFAFGGGSFSVGNLSKPAAGVLVLSTSNSILSGSVSAGTVVAGNPFALGTNRIAFSGATVQITNTNVTSLAASLAIGAGGLTFDHGHDLTLSGAVSGSNNVLTKTGSGTLTISGSLGVSAEKAGVAVSAASGAVVLVGAAKDLGGTSAFDVPLTASNVTINLNQNCNLTGVGLLSFNGTTVNAVFGAPGNSAVALNADFAGTNTLNSASGRVLRFETGAISGSGLINITGNGSVQMVGTNESTFNGAINYATTNANTFVLSAQTAENVSSITNTGVLVLSNALAGTASVVNAVIAGAGSVTKAGAGTVVLAGPNSYTGGTTVSSGTLVASTATVPGNTVVGTGAFFKLRQNVDGLFGGSISGAGTFLKEGTGTVTLGGSNSHTGGTVIDEGALICSVANLPGSVTNNAVLVFDQGSNGLFANAISGVGSLRKTGIGTLTLSSANNYGGGTVISGGTLKAGSVSAFGSGAINIEDGGTFDYAFLDITNQVINNGGTVINSAGGSLGSFASGTYEITTNNSTITEISGTASLYVSGANITVSSMVGGLLDVGSSGVTVGSYSSGSISVGGGFSVNIQSGNSGGVISGEGGLVKTGTNALVLAASNTYTGATVVSSGRLTVNGSIAGSSVTVTNGGTIAGTGTLGATTVAAAGTLAPGNGVGLIEVAGSLTLKPSGNYNWQIQNAVGAAGTGYDHVEVSGALDLTSLSATNKFAINLGTLSGSSAGQAINFNRTQSYSWILVTASGGFVGALNPAHFTVNTGAVNGAEGFQNDASGGSFTVTQEGNSLLLVYTPAGAAGASGAISITNSFAGANAVAPGQWYVQNFNAVLPTGGSVAWTNNTTLPGWYAASGTNPTNSFTNIFATFPSPTNESGSLYSVPQHFDNNTPTSSYRAIAVAPHGTTGPNHIALRFVNNTTNTITGFTVSYEMRWGYSQDGMVDSFDVIAGGSGYSSAPSLSVSGSTTGSNAAGSVTVNGSGNVSSISKTASGSGYVGNPVLSFSGSGSGAVARAIMKLSSATNAVTLSHKTFDANTGTLANFASAGWTTVAAKTNANTTVGSVPDNWNYVLANVTNISLAPGKELWLNWQVTRIGTNSSLVAIDNVRVGNFARANPSITAQPMAQSIILSNNATLSVTASGVGALTYQWRKDGTNITGATAAMHTITNAQPSSIGNYDVVVTSGANSATSSVAPVQVYSRSGVRGAASNSVVAAPALASYIHAPEYRDIAVANTNSYTNKFDLYLPDAPVPTSGRPAVVVIHGGGGNDGDKADGREVQACQEFASHGYVALSINYKRSFQTKSTGNWTVAWPQNIKDAKTAVRWLRTNATNYGIDPNRIGAIGFSWGGNEAAMLALTDGDPALDPALEDNLGVQSAKVSCAANFYGAVQIPDYHNMNQFGGNGVPGTAGTMDAATNNYVLASPASRASSSAAPMLLHFGDADLEVMPTQNEALRAALNNAGAKTETVIVPGGKHSYSLYETDAAQGGSITNPIDVRPHVLGFYDSYLQPRAAVVTSASSVSGVRNSAISHQVFANNGATLFTMSGQTNGFSINPTNGLISGTLPSSGTRTVTAYATGPSGTAVQNITFTAVDGLTVSNSVVGTTPALLGYNLAHFTDNGNGFDWFRSSGVKAARVFISANELQSQTSPGRSRVTNETSFWSTINSTRTAGTNSTTYIRWSDFNYDYTSTAGANDITFKYAFTQLRGIGADILANITASPGTFPIASAGDWAGKWELWQHYYAQAYLLSRDYGITRFSMFNEPNNWTGMTEPDWFQRLRICSDAIQRAIADVNAAKGLSLVPRIYAPNTASGKEKYNTASDTWGTDTIVNRYLQLSNVTNAAWTPKTNSIPWSLSHVYNYQKYSMLTHDDGSLTGYVDDIVELRGYIDADNGTDPEPPVALTEFNVRTGASYDTKTENQDTPSDYVALGANSVALTANGADELFLFKFGQTESGGTNYLVAKNGTHYVQNASGTANNYGGATKAARVYQLFNKGAVGGRDRLAFTPSAGATNTTTGGVWSMVARDAGRGLLHAFLANKGSSSVPMALNLSASGVPDGSPVIVEEVSSASSGHGRVAGNVSGGQIALGSIPRESVWLVTVPSTASGIFTLEAAEDAELSDGINRNLPGGSVAAMRVRADGTANGRRGALIKIPVSGADVAKGRRFYLDLEVASSSGASPVQAHLYGVGNDSWNDATITWVGSSFLRQNVGTGSQIAYNTALNSGSNPVCRILGAVTASSTSPSRVLVDVTDFVKAQTDGAASFIVLQDHRWDFSADPVATRSTGDIQPAGIVVSSREKTGAAPRLIGLSSSAPSEPPAILSSPSDQYLEFGDTVTLSVSADLSSAVTYQWRKDGVVIPGANSSTLVIANATAAEAGIYTVDVSNAFGTTTSAETVVAINSAPVLIEPLPANVAATVGDPVVLSATFTGSPPPTYTWRKDGVVIPGAADSSYSFIAASGSSGAYTVTAQNAAGSVSSSTTLSVTAAPTGLLSISALTDGITENFNALGKSTSFRIGTTNYYSWSNGDGWSNGTGFTNKLGWYGATDDNRNPFEGYRTVNDGNEDLNNVPTRSRSGLAAMGSGSSSTNRSLGGVPWTNNRVYLGVRIRNATTNSIQGCTVIYTLQQFSSASTNRSATKVVASTAVNPASLRSPGWSGFATNDQFVYQTRNNSYGGINGTTAANSRRLTNVVSNLSVGPGDSLWIRWDISTTTAYPLGMAIDDLVVTNFVAAAGPVISNNPVSLTKVSGETAAFEVVAAAQPSPSFQWMKNGTNIEGATEPVLTISPARAADAGSYQVRVSNLAGSSTSAPAELSILPRPAAVIQPPTASAIVYGQTLSRSELTGGEGSVPGSFSFSAPALSPNAGTNEQTVTFWPSDTANYSAGSATVFVVVDRASQTISFGPLPSKKLGDAAFAISAAASSGLPLHFASSNESVAALSGNILTIRGVGSSLIMAMQPGDSNYLPADAVQQSFTVSAAGPSFASEFGGAEPTSDSDGDGVSALLEYAFGGSTNRNDWDLLPRIDEAGPEELSIRYFARTNDPSLVFRPVGTRTLSGAWTTNGIVTTVLGTTNIGSNAVQVRRATMPLTNESSGFLRLDVGLQP